MNKNMLPIDMPIAPTPSELKSGNSEVMWKQFESNFEQYLKTQNSHFNRALRIMNLCSIIRSFESAFFGFKNIKHFSWCPSHVWEEHYKNSSPFDFLPKIK